MVKLNKEFLLADQLFNEPVKKSPTSLLCSVRILIALLSLLGTSIMYVTRVNLNIAILAMVKSDIPIEITADVLPPPSPPPNVTATDLDIPSNISNLIFSSDTLTPVISLPVATTRGEFEWSPPQQGIILGSFFYGYLATQIIGGRLAEAYISPAKLIFIALSTSGVINLFTPFMARNSVPVFVTSRIVLGAFQGVIYPAFYCLFSRWIPSNERSTFIPWLDAGATIGTIMTSASSGQIIVWFAHFGGWPVVFYFSSTLALIWSLFWVIFVRSDPEEHPLINKDELTLLVNDQKSQSSNSTVSPCWSNILTSRVFYSLLIVKVCYGIVFDFVTQKIPAYLQDVIHFPVNENGLAFAVVMIGYMLALLTGGLIADSIISKTSFTKCQVRKGFQFVSSLTMAVSLILIPYAGINKWVNVFLLTTCMIGYGFTSGGDLPLTADISGQISGTVFATMNTLCSISGFAVPYLVGIVIEPDPKSIHLWRYLFFVSAFLIVFGTSIFISFASADLQTHWCKSDGSLYQKIDTQMLEFTESLNIVNQFKFKYIPRYDTFTI